MAIDILNEKLVEAHGLLSKIQIGGKIYEIKDAVARAKLNELLNQAHIAYTGIYADDAAIKAALEAGDKAVKDYVDAQVGSINKFDVRVLAADEELPAASADTMYILFLKPDANAEADAFIEYITIRSGEEGAYTYAWEAIGSTKMDVSGLVTEEELAAELANYTKTADLGDLAFKDEADLDLKALAHKDSASGTVAGQTISGVKATGTSTGSITVELEQSEHKMTSAGKFTPAGNVAGTVATAGSIAVTAKYDATDAVLSKGDYTPAGTVSANLNHAATAATLEMSKHAPEGTVSVELSGTSFNKITGVGTQASFKEGAFTPAALDHSVVTASYVDQAIIGSVDEDECLTFTEVGTKSLSASKVNSFSGGAKAADEFVANSLPTMEAHNVGVQNATFTGTEHECVTGVKYDKASLSDLIFTGTKAEGALVTGVSYQKADIGSATFTGQTVDINATFSGTEGDVSVDGNCHDYAVKTAQFNGAAIELAVGDIVVSEKSVTVQ